MANISFIKVIMLTNGCMGNKNVTLIEPHLA